MDWVKDFYTRQYAMMNSPYWWQQMSPSDPPEYARRTAAAIERFAGPGTKRVLELGCGGGVVAGTIAFLGHTVTAVEIIDAAIENVRRIAAEVPNGELTAVQGDFYELEFPEKFDVVCYFDGFGVGSDADQRRLLKRTAGWLEPNGCAVIDIYSPWGVAAANGETSQEETMYGVEFDADGSRQLASQWPVGADQSEAITQYLRCYSPADLRLLLEGTGLVLETYEAYGDEGPCPLIESWFYRSKLVPAPGA